MRAAVYAVLEDQKKVLLLRRFNTGYRDGEYTLPAGHVEPNETFLQTCVRELKEEICVDVLPEDLQMAHVMQRHENGVNYTDYYFVVKKWQGDPKIGEPHKSDDLKWVNKSEIRDHAIHFVSKAIENSLEGILFSHDGLDELGRL
jgi:ADP-ribose pyrophosphatase YjhB (NUDIX family)